MVPDEPRQWALAQLEALYRLTSVRSVIDAIAIGDWPIDGDVIRQLAILTEQAGRWAEVAAAFEGREAA